MSLHFCWRRIIRHSCIAMAMVPFGAGEHGGMLYCATTALDGYPSHLDKIHYIWMVTSFYICSTAFYKPWQSSLPSSSFPLPFIFYFWLIFASIWAEPPMSHIISSFTQHYLSCLHIKGLLPAPAVPIILETRCGMWWKARQWRF